MLPPKKRLLTTEPIATSDPFSRTFSRQIRPLKLAQSENVFYLCIPSLEKSQIRPLFRDTEKYQRRLNGLFFFFFFFFFFLEEDDFFFIFKETHINYLHCSYSTYNTTLSTYSSYNTTLNTYSTYNTTLNTYSTYNTTLNTYSTYNTIQYSTKQYVTILTLFILD